VNSDQKKKKIKKIKKTRQKSINSDLKFALGMIREDEGRRGR
jgi:hypothetical protein